MDIKSRFQRAWLATDPVLRKGELIHDRTAGQLKIGDGEKRWSELTYLSSGGLTELPSYLEEDALKRSFETVELLGRRRDLPPLALVDRVMTTPPTIGALSTSSAIPNSLYWPATEKGAIARDRFTYIGGGGIEAYGTSYPNDLYVRATSLTTTNSASAPFSVEFLFDGTQLEINTKGLTGFYQIRVDDELVSAIPGQIASTGSVYFLPITFADRRLRRITFETAGLVWGGVRTGPNDTISSVDVRGPRAIVVGDSFTEGGTGNSFPVSAWPHKMGRLLGWRDLWRSGVGGTGYLAPGAVGRVKFRDRLENDVISRNPDIVVWAGGINDHSHASYTYAALRAEALACYEQVRDALPNVVQIVISPFWRGGPETLSASLLEARDALRDAAESASAENRPVYFVDVVELPLDSEPIVGVLTGATGTNSTTFPSSVPFARGMTVEIGASSGQSRIRRVVTGVAGSASPYTITVQGAMPAQSSGATVRQVGRMLWSGSGRVGAVTGVGNADLYVGTDGTHPTPAGQEIIGTTVANLISRHVLAA